MGHHGLLRDLKVRHVTKGIELRSSPLLAESSPLDARLRQEPLLFISGAFTARVLLLAKLSGHDGSLGFFAEYVAMGFA